MTIRPDYFGLVGSVVRQLVRGPRSMGDTDVRAMVAAALGAARSDLSDEQAAKRLRSVAKNAAVAREAKERLQKGRDTYVVDRAFRLADAAWRGGSVQPPEYAQGGLLDQERELGQAALKDAFARLV